MATFPSTCAVNAVIFVFVFLQLRISVGSSIHLMSVTPTPYGAGTNPPFGTPPPSFVCLLSPPDTDLNLVDAIAPGRHVRRGSSVGQINQLALPDGSTFAHDTSSIKVTTLPARNEAEGVFYCELSSNGLTTRVPVTIVGYNLWLRSTLGQFTITVSYGETAQFPVDVIFTLVGKNALTDILWEKIAKETVDIEILPYTGTSYQITNVMEEHAGVYHVYWRGLGHSATGFLFRLIVRACIQGKWGPPSCARACDNCYNGGICDDKTGECVCRPGFTGPNCLTACGENKFGWSCEHQCGISFGVLSCSGSVFCMPDPTGCSCMTGWMGAECNEACPPGKYGAGCTETCYCKSGSCDRFTGRCDGIGGCTPGRSGEACQIPQFCPFGYHGSNCTGICRCSNCDKTDGCTFSVCLIGYWGGNCETECHCYNGGGCGRQTGKCFTDITSGLSVCEPGYVSSTGVNLDNCQQFTSCFAGCTKTCHCFGNVPCNSVTGHCPVGTSCQTNWAGESCQSGIVEAGSEKTNPGQPVIVVCTVTGDPVPTADQVTLVSFRQNTPIEEQPQIMTYGQFVRVTFNVTGQHTVFNCFIREDDVNNIASTVIVPMYYTLPSLTSTPMTFPGSTTSTSALLRWDAWNPDAGDTGDGPIVGYNIYDLTSTTHIDSAPASVGISPITRMIEGLTPNREYIFNVRPVREGLGGEGTSTAFVVVTTLPAPTLSSPIRGEQITTLEATLKGSSPTMGLKTDKASASLATTVPGPPTAVTTASTTSTSVTLSWNDPFGSNEAIVFYRIDYRAIHSLPQSSDLLVGPFTNTTTNIGKKSEGYYTYVLGNLDPGTLYEVYISAENMAGIGQPVLHIVETKPLDLQDEPLNSNVVVIAGGASGVFIFIIILVIIVVLVFRIRKRHLANNSQVKNEGTRFANQAFSPDIDGYEDVDLDDQEYEEVASSKWDIAWEDLKLSGNILGKGNFGEVQLGKVRIKDKWIMAAIKTLKQGTPANERALFREEFDTMTRIGYHPNVVNILGSCEHEGSFYVILEYVHHGNLRKFLRMCRKERKTSVKKRKLVNELNPEQLLNFALGVARAMKHISDCGVIHRDLAARNILVGRGFKPKVADFGMSREENVYVQTSSGRVPTRWLSIESMTKKTYSTKSDVWSFGILLWEIVTFGGTPYPDMETRQLASHLTGGYRMLKPDNCEDDMYELMLQCWQENPDARPSFKDIVDILTDMASQDKIYMSTHFYDNFKYAMISPDKDDR